MTYHLKCERCGKVTEHRRAGHFVADGDGSEAKIVYECGRCAARRVWGSVDLSRVSLDEKWVLLGPKVEYVAVMGER